MMFATSPRPDVQISISSPMQRGRNGLPFSHRRRRSRIHHDALAKRLSTPYANPHDPPNTHTRRALSGRRRRRRREKSVRRRCGLFFYFAKSLTIHFFLTERERNARDDVFHFLRQRVKESIERERDRAHREALIRFTARALIGFTAHWEDTNLPIASAPRQVHPKPQRSHLFANQEYHVSGPMYAIGCGARPCTAQAAAPPAFLDFTLARILCRKKL